MLPRWRRLRRWQTGQQRLPPDGGLGQFKDRRFTRLAWLRHLLDSKRVDFEYDGEMTVDVALDPDLMALYPFCRLKGPANVLIMPALHSAHISANLLEELGVGTVVGPILMGMCKPVQIANWIAAGSGTGVTLPCPLLRSPSNICKSAAVNFPSPLISPAPATLLPLTSTGYSPLMTKPPVPAAIAESSIALVPDFPNPT